MIVDTFFAMKDIKIIKYLALLIAASAVFNAHAQAQPGQDKGELDDVKIDIVIDRKITLPEANRNFDKIPPRPSEPIKPPITYDFRAFTFQTPQITPLIRPL